MPTFAAEDYDPPPMRCFLLFIVMTLLVSVVSAGTVDPPQRIKIQKLDKTEIAGLITSFDEDSFDVMDAKKQTQTYKWDELPADTVMTLHARLIQKGTADQWFKLGKKLLTMPGGRPAASGAFARA